EIKLSIKNGVLSLRGNKQIKKGMTTESMEIERSIAVPSEVCTDKIEARYEDGILEVTLPKREDVKPKEITIQVK
ncbi:MAG: Hsp20/alpha crystallin family protein, partial [Verrucomicrobiota bacterium]